MYSDSLWGEEFIVPDNKEKAKKIKAKIKNPTETQVSVEKQVKSKKLSINEKMDIIKAEVLRVLGKQANNILCIKNRADFHSYIDKAIVNGRIDIDTETNNTTDTFTCQLMGPCLYTPGEKQIYVPLNHRDTERKERLSWQLTENDVKEEFQRLIENNVKIIMHNADFDYQVIYKTCNVELPIYWDTMLAAQVLDENEPASLKEQYISKIDPEQEKYSINKLFEGVYYADVDPEIFAYYAATDALMTDKLYEWQVKEFQKPDNSKIYKVFRDVEMGVMPVVAKMELRGVSIDQEFNKRLHDKYTNLLTKCDEKIDIELKALQPTIDAWKLSPEANEKTRSYQPKKTKMTEAEIAEKYPLVDEKGRYKIGKAMIDQLGDPINMASPTQLAILFYDILKAPVVDKKQPRATGEDALIALAEKTDLNICKLLVERRGLVKLLSTYIDNIPQLVNFWGDGKIRTHFKQYGAKTGRFSSGGSIKYMDNEGHNREISGANAQNIPAHLKELRMQFMADKNKVLTGADYSAQEVRMTAFMTQDLGMIQAYKEGKDLYSVVASNMYDNKYEDNLEFYPAGTEMEFEGNKVICGNKTHLNKEGKARRQSAKSVLIG